MAQTQATYTMDDTTIGHVAQLLQLAILTGTDIIDHFRSARFTVGEDGATIALHPDYAENFDANLQKMLSEAAEQKTTNDPQQTFTLTSEGFNVE